MIATFVIPALKSAASFKFAAPIAVKLPPTIVATLYQLYAYGKKYKQKLKEKGQYKKVQLFLIYPMTEKFNIFSENQL